MSSDTPFADLYHEFNSPCRKYISDDTDQQTEFVAKFSHAFPTYDVIAKTVREGNTLMDVITVFVLDSCNKVFICNTRLSNDIDMFFQQVNKRYTSKSIDKFITNAVTCMEQYIKQNNWDLGVYRTDNRVFIKILNL